MTVGMALKPPPEPKSPALPQPPPKSAPSPNSILGVVTSTSGTGMETGEFELAAMTFVIELDGADGFFIT